MFLWLLGLVGSAFLAMFTFASTRHACVGVIKVGWVSGDTHLPLLPVHSVNGERSNLMDLLNQPRTPEAIAEACEQTAEVLEGQWTQGDWYTPPFMDRSGDRHPATYCVEGALAAVLGIEAVNMQRNSRDVTALRNCAVYRAVRDTIRETRRRPVGDACRYGSRTTGKPAAAFDVLHHQQREGWGGALDTPRGPIPGGSGPPGYPGRGT